MVQYGRAPIHWAAARGNIEIMEMLIAANCDIEARDKVSHYYIFSLIHSPHLNYWVKRRLLMSLLSIQ